MKCDQCCAAIINGVFCHERGCPNSGKKYDEENEQWINMYDCNICGYPVVEGEVCSCYNEQEY